MVCLLVTTLHIKYVYEFNRIRRLRVNKFNCNRLIYEATVAVSAA